jgi:hypothetical protein
MQIRKMKVGEREVSLKVWLLNNSAIEVADQCGVTRMAINYAKNDKSRDVRLYIKAGKITFAFERVNEIKPVFGFKN